MDRRKFVCISTHLTGGAVAGFSALQALACNDLALRQPEAVRGAGGYGPLFEAGPELALPEGFEYRVIGVEGTQMSD